jgi:hypothetical protein
MLRKMTGLEEVGIHGTPTNSFFDVSNQGLQSNTDRGNGEEGVPPRSDVILLVSDVILHKQRG